MKGGHHNQPKGIFQVKKAIFLAAALMAVAGQASAREFADIYTDCGLGAVIAPHNGAVAAGTNVTWDLGTTALSSHARPARRCKGGQPKSAALASVPFRLRSASAAALLLSFMTAAVAADPAPAALARDPQWLRLLHVGKDGRHSEIHSPEFFLSPQGAADPEAELNATLDAL